MTSFIWRQTYLSIGQQGVHSLQEAGVQHVGLIQDEHNLLPPAAGATQNGPQVLVKVFRRVLPMHLCMYTYITTSHTYAKRLLDMVRQEKSPLLNRLGKEGLSSFHIYTHTPTHTLPEHTYLDLIDGESIDPGHKS